MDETLLNTIRWLYQQTQIYDGEQAYNIRQGVIQGGILSHTLFNVFANDFIQEIDNENLDVLSYADDIAI